MRTELAPLTGREDVSVTRFFGGSDRGISVQLTQEVHDGPWARNNETRIMYIQFSEKQLRELVLRANAILEGREPEWDEDQSS